MDSRTIEVEVRSFISAQEYERLERFFDENAQLVMQDEQETHYFDTKEDLRIQKNKEFSKVWLKKGELHDDHREEIEVKVDDFDNIAKLFDALGHNVEIKWFRHRKEYRWGEIAVMLDHTKGYGRILELEIMSTPEEKEEKLELLRSKMKELHIEITPKEEFKKQFENYKKNWQKLIKEDGS